MFKPSSKTGCAAVRGLAGHRSALLATVCLVLLQAPLAASAGLAGVEDSPPGLDRSTPVKKAASGYRLRCWQHGRLLFEEDNIALPPDGSRYALKLAGSDSDGRPLYVAETANATCLARHATGVPPNPALPR